MGTIARVSQVPSERYNKILVYKGSGNVAMAGWGVRAREEDPGMEGDSLVCLSHPMRANTVAKYVSFRVINASGTPDNDFVVVSIWKYPQGGINLTKVYRKKIDKAVLEENYGTGTTFTDDTEYTITLEEDGVYLEPISGVTYYMCVYADGCELELDLDGTTNGAYIRTGTDISDGNDTYALASLTLSDKAVSFELFSEPDTWVRQLKGGAIALENTDWHNVLYCTASGWANPDRIYDGTAAHADSIAIGDYILIDLGAGLAPVTPWPGPLGVGLSLGNDEDVFPDYSAYGVRCLYELILTFVISNAGDPGKIEVLISAEDDASAPSYGYERILTLDSTSPSPHRIQIPAIARWIKIVHTTGADQIEISDFEVQQISYGITDGKFPVDVLSSTHNVWIENYPTEEKMRRLAMGNMAGGVSLPGKPFTNRENID